MAEEIPNDEGSNKPNTTSPKWGRSCGGQAVIVGCGTPIFLFLLAAIFSADEFALLIPIIFIFFTLPLLVIGLVSDGKKRTSESVNLEKNQVDEISPSTYSSEEASPTSTEDLDDEDPKAN